MRHFSKGRAAPDGARRPNAVWYAIPAAALAAAAVVPLASSPTMAAEPCKPGPNLTEIQEQEVALRPTPWDPKPTMTFKQFDTAGGSRQLTKVLFSRGIEAVQTYTVFNPRSDSRATIITTPSMNVTVGMTWGGPALGELKVEEPGKDVNTVIVENLLAPGGPKKEDNSPGAWAQFVNNAQKVDTGFEFTEPAELSFFAGTGNVVVTGSAEALQSGGVISGGNVSQEQITDARLGAGLRYEYVCAWMSVTKTVTPSTPGAEVPDWSFNFKIDPAPADGSPATVTVTKAKPSATFEGLVPGATYKVSEDASPGYVPGLINCGTGSGTATAQGGTTVACTAQNTYTVPPPPTTPPPTTPPPPCVTPPGGVIPPGEPTPPGGWCPVTPPPPPCVTPPGGVIPPGATTPPGGWCPVPPCVTPPPGTTPTPGSTPPGGGTWCPVPPCVTPPPGVTPTPGSTPPGGGTWCPVTPCVTPPPGVTPTPGSTPPGGGTWCPIIPTPAPPCVTPPPGVTPAPGSTPPGGGTWCPVPPPTCLPVGSDGVTNCAIVPLSVKAAKASTRVPRGKWVTVVTSAKTTSVGKISTSVSCMKSGGSSASGCSHRHYAGNKLRVKVTGCKATSLKVRITANPRDAYVNSYSANIWTRTWRIKGC